jgi:hypothetical protein
MRSKALAIRATPEMSENRAKWCQLSGHFAASRAFTPQARASHERIGPTGRKANCSPLITSGPFLILVLLLGLPAVLGAETQKDSWSNLNGLKAGQGIEVIESHMKRHAGEFVTVTDEALTLQEGGSDISIKREDIARVSTSSAPRRGGHAVIGLVVGGAIGAAIGAASGSKHGFLGGSDRGIAALVGIVIGAPSGALVGAVLPAHTTVYRVAPAVASH